MHAANQCPHLLAHTKLTYVLPMAKRFSTSFPMRSRLYNYGFLRNDKITVEETTIGILDCISQYLYNSSEGKETELYGYSLRVEVTGTRDGRHWEKPRAYTRNVGNVGIPMAIATDLIAKGEVNKSSHHAGKGI